MHTNASKRKPSLYSEAQEKKLLRTRDQNLGMGFGVGEGLSLCFPFLILYFLSRLGPSSHPNTHHPTSLHPAPAVVPAAAQGPKTPRENSYFQAKGPQERPLCSEEEEYGGNPHFNYFPLPLYPENGTNSVELHKKHTFLF